MDGRVVQVYEKLAAASTGISAAAVFGSKKEKVLVGVAIGGLIAAILVAVTMRLRSFPYGMVIVLSLLIVSQLAGMGLVMIPTVSTIRFLGNPTRNLIVGLKKVHTEELELVDQLSEFDKLALDAVATRLRLEGDGMRTRIGFMFGAYNKLGIVPSAVALYFAYAKYRQDSGSGSPTQIGNYVAALVVGLYLGTVIASNVIDRFGELTRLLQDASAVAHARPGLQQPSKQQSVPAVTSVPDITP